RHIQLVHRRRGAAPPGTEGEVMPQGRCAGCERTGPARKIAAHILNCPGYQALFAASPDKALGPLAEAARHEQDGKACGNAARKDRIAQAAQVTLERRAAQAARFARLPDILED